MIVYEAEEKVGGLADLVRANVSIAYTTNIFPCQTQDKDLVLSHLVDRDTDYLSKASINDSDLYFTKSILVTTNWNLNDDVFYKYEVWAARHTPVHKRTNLEHDETNIVGHMTNTWAFDDDGNIIPDNAKSSELPDLFHLANGAVIYTAWQEENLAKQAEKLIEQIENNEKFVSMEALFSGFDYAVMTADNEFYIVARQQDTAFLTKHLKAYKGSGEFDGCRLGRLLRNITFSGKGYVDKPANPDSVMLFDGGKTFNVTASAPITKNPFSTHNGVFISCSDVFSSNKKLENTHMSDTLSIDLLQKQNEELKATVEELQKEVKNYSKASVDEKIKAFESKVSELEGKVESLTKERDEALASVEKLTKAKEEADKNLSEVVEAKDALEKQVAEIKLQQTKSDRISVLVEAGYDRDSAEAKVDTFIDLDDDKFKVIADELIEAKKHMKDDKKKKDEDMSMSSQDDDPSDDPEGSASASAADVDNAEPTNNDGPDMSASASDNDDEVELRDELRQALAARLGYDDKGEE